MSTDEDQDPDWAEQELLAILREQEPSDRFHIEIELADGAWEISLTAPLKGRDRVARDRTIRGTGKTFSAAWEGARRTDEG